MAGVDRRLAIDVLKRTGYEFVTGAFCAFQRGCTQAPCTRCACDDGDWRCNVAVAQEAPPQPAGPSEDYEPDSSPDVVGGPGGEEFLPYTEDPQPAGPSEAYETRPEPRT